jgi:hypothetical protein
MERDSADVQNCKLVLIDRGSGFENAVPKLGIHVYCRNGITKSHQVSCMDTQEVYQGQVDKMRCPYWMRCEARTIRQYMDHMALKAEVFQMTFNTDKVELFSFTEAVSSENEIIKRPLNTHIVVDVSQFDGINAVANMTIGFRLKEFRQFVALADSFQSHARIEGYFYGPGVPLLFEVAEDCLPPGVQIVFVFLTNGRELESTEEQQEYIRFGRRNVPAADRLIVTPEITAQPTHNKPDYESVSWDNRPNTDTSSAYIYDEETDEEFEQELAKIGAQYAASTDRRTRTGWASLDDDLDQHGHSDSANGDGIGPTQNASQAKGIFD